MLAARPAHFLCSIFIHSTASMNERPRKSPMEPPTEATNAPKSNRM